ncbi:MAG: hypothetical protein GC165_01070 [Armatimonadetes bacterium]|nr:hypothetical protein [Armatimonadota bacterium]
MKHDRNNDFALGLVFFALLSGGCSGPRSTASATTVSVVDLAVLRSKPTTQIVGDPDSEGVTQYWYEFDMDWHMLASKVETDPALSHWKQGHYSKGVVFTNPGSKLITVTVHEGGGTASSYNDTSKSSIMVSVRK